MSKTLIHHHYIFFLTLK